MDDLDRYWHYEQQGDDLLVYINDGEFTEQTFDINYATQMI